MTKQVVIGRLDKYVQIQARTDTTSPTTGVVTESWSTVESSYASIQPLDLIEEFKEGRREVTASHVIELRYTPILTTSHQILFGSRVFEVRRVRNVDEANVKLVVLAWERP